MTIKEEGGQEGPDKLLVDFEGVLQTDDFAIYWALFDKKDTVTLAACMAHSRRKFDETASYYSLRATYVVAQIAKLYTLEQKNRDAGDMEERTICQLRLNLYAIR